MTLCPTISHQRIKSGGRDIESVIWCALFSQISNHKLNSTFPPELNALKAIRMYFKMSRCQNLTIPGDDDIRISR